MKKHEHRWVRDGSMIVGIRRVQRKRCSDCGARSITGEMPEPKYQRVIPANIGIVALVEREGFKMRGFVREDDCRG